MEAAEFKDKLITAFLTLQVYREESLNPVCREYGITVQQFHIMMELEDGFCRKAGDLSDTVGILRGNMAGICKKMEQNGWITRERSTKDERVVLVSLTAEGKKIRSDILSRMEEIFQVAIANEPEETFEAIFSGLDHLGRLMKKMK